MRQRQGAGGSPLLGGEAACGDARAPEAARYSVERPHAATAGRRMQSATPPPPPLVTTTTSPRSFVAAAYTRLHSSHQAVASFLLLLAVAATPSSSAALVPALTARRCSRSVRPCKERERRDLGLGGGSNVGPTASNRFGQAGRMAKIGQLDGLASQIKRLLEDFFPPNLLKFGLESHLTILLEMLLLTF